MLAECGGLLGAAGDGRGPDYADWVAGVAFWAGIADDRSLCPRSRFLTRSGCQASSSPARLCCQLVLPYELPSHTSPNA